MKEHPHSRRALALLLAVVLCFSLIPTAFAAQQNSYHDPAEHWLSASDRTNELDANAVVTHETFRCGECNKQTSFLTFRTPEYTKDGKTAMSRNVQFSDGTLSDGQGKGSLLNGTPGQDAYYTGYHFTKAICETCGGINTNRGKSDYGYLKNVYWLHDCDAKFTENLEETLTYTYADSQYHTVTTTGGTYCCFCYGTNHTKSSKLVRHEMETEVLSQPANGRFVRVEKCRQCDYASYAYTTAKAVVASYYGVADGKPHTISVTDLSESGVRATIRYGNSADACTLSSAPNYTEAGQYTVYYAITYTYKGQEMTENGVAYVWLRDQGTKENGSCACGCGDPNCGCQDKDCKGDCCTEKGCGKNHKFTLLESVKPGCTTLGYDRYLCTACGKIEKRDYVDSPGHAWQGIVLRDATCESDGKLLELCARCGQMKQTDTPKGEHNYAVHTVAATCTMPGYTVKECIACGDRHITDMTAALPHNYEATVIPATCEAGGKTIHRCEGCGSAFVTDAMEALGHTWDKGTLVTNATCTSEGIMEYRCIRCGYHRLEGNAASGHDYKVEVIQPTCTEMGYTIHTCTRCGHTYRDSYTKATGHKPGDWIIDQQPTTDTEGSKHKECQECGETLDTQPIDKLKVSIKHGIYIEGYPDGSFGPERGMTRAEAATIFARLLAEKNGDNISTVAKTKFEDIPAHAWYSGYVKYLNNHGVAYGKTKTTFAPEDAITRAEYTALAVRFFEVYGDGSAEIMEKYKRFDDVSEGDWAASYIQAAAKYGWVNGYEDGSFHPSRQITRAEVVTLTNRLLGRSADEAYVQEHLRQLNTFHDLSKRHWAYYEVMESANAHTGVLGENETWSK